MLGPRLGRRGFRESSARLAQSLRIDPRITLYAPEPLLEELELIPAEADLNSLIEEALASRPEISEATMRIEAARIEERASRKGPWFPRVFLGANLDGFGPDPGDIRDRETLELGLSWDLSPRRFGRREEARVRLRQQNLDHARLREEITGAVVRHYEFAQVSSKAIESARHQVEASSAALEVVLDRRRSGAALVVEVLEAARQVALARRDLLQRVLEHNQAQRRLSFAAGR